MFGIGGFEFFLILLFAFLVFGPDRLPALAKTVGQAIAKLRSMQSEMNEVVKTEIYEPAGIDPTKNPLQALEDLGNQALAESTKTETSASDENPYLATFAERKAKYDAERAARKALAESQQNKDAGSESAGTAEEPSSEQDTVQALYGNVKPAQLNETSNSDNEAQDDSVKSEPAGEVSAAADAAASKETSEENAAEVKEVSEDKTAHAGAKGDN